MLVLEDQDRFQPWVYQFVMFGVALATLPAGRALGLARLWTVALYFHSALSKLDVSFCREMGPALLGAGLRPIGLDPRGWPPAWRSTAALAMPAWEMAVAVGLVVRRTRPWALVGAVVQHGALIAILGPFGLGHSPNVLIWNAALIVEDLILFRPGAWAEGVVEPDSRLGPLVRGAFALAAVLPFGERLGLWDSWPSFALYASHTERVEVFARRDEVADWPSGARPHLRPLGDGSWVRLDLTDWSRAVRGVPLYPQARACLGLAEALAGRTSTGRSPRVVVWGRADRWTGRRDRDEAEGLDAIRRLGNRYRYRLNAHPARAKAGSA
jgi:hypothetical protein